MTLRSATDVTGLWQSTLQEVVQRAAHEVKDALNGVSLNLEVIRSRSQDEGGGVDAASIAGFAGAAAEQLELLTERTEALLALSRPPKPSAGPCDVAATLRQLAALLVPAARADGGQLVVDVRLKSAPTSASADGARLALATGLLGIIGNRGEWGRLADHERHAAGRGRCTLHGDEEGVTSVPEDEIVVRFSHESADTCSLDPAIAAAITSEGIRYELTGSDLSLVFPR
jgi:nitrogen fixation/metabolism regulation signal transduction histidine kinase